MEILGLDNGRTIDEYYVNTWYYVSCYKKQESSKCKYKTNLAW